MNNPIFSSFFNKSDAKSSRSGQSKKDEKDVKKVDLEAKKRNKNRETGTGGNSRASKKRRKKLEAKRDCVDKVLDDDDDDNDDNNYSDRNFALNGHREKESKIKPIKKVVNSDINNNNKANHLYQKDDVELEEGQSIIDLLNLKDVVDIDAYSRGAKLIASITHPCSRSDFFSVYYEKQPFVFTDSTTTNRFKNLFNKQAFDQIIKENALVTSDVAIVSPVAAPAEAIVSPVAASAERSAGILEVKSKDIHNGIRDGSIIRLLCPQKYNDNIWKLLSGLEFEFGAAVTCNVHYNNRAAYAGSCNEASSNKGVNAADADIFVLQLDGVCKYQVWNSKNEIALDKALLKGDVMYIPRGWSYLQCTHVDAVKTEEKVGHSLNLHLITNNCNSNSVSNLLEGMLSQAIQQLGAEGSSITCALPHQYHNYLGVAHSEDDENPYRNKLLKQLKSHLNNVVSSALDMADAAVDQQVKQFLIDRLPVPMTEEEEQLSSWRSPDIVIHPYTKLRLLRPGIARAIVEDGMVVVYHCMDNSRELHGASINPLEYDLDDGPCIEELLLSYPQGVTVADLKHPSEELDDKVSVAQSLYKEGILLIDDEASKPTQPGGSDEDSDSPF